MPIFVPNTQYLHFSPAGERLFVNDTNDLARPWFALGKVLMGFSERSRLLKAAP